MGSTDFQKDRDSQLKEYKLLFLMLVGLWFTHFISYDYFSSQSLGVFLFPLLIALALRSVFSPLFSYHFVLVLIVVLNQISEVKYLFTQKVLEVRDFLFLGQAAQVRDFLPLKSLFIILIACLTLLIPYRKIKVNFKAWFLVVLLALGHYFYLNSTDFMRATNTFLAEYGNAKFNVWNLRENIRNNGVLFHLSQTLSLMNKPEKGPHHFYDGETEFQKSNAPFKKYDIFLVVCESCYFDEKKNSVFHNDMGRLLQNGYKLSTLLSPTYGGGTSEAEFELITGLPSKVLPGVKFQLYGDSFSDMATSLPSFLSDSGYLSFYYHNADKKNWKRDEVITKFHYRHAYFIDDMEFDNSSEWARDSFLYRKALKQYQESIKSNAPVFNQMMTVYTHGSYQVDHGDGGVGDYSRRIALSMSDYLEFEKNIVSLAKSAGREVAFVLVGDHKPALNKVFFDSDISPEYYMSGREAPLKDDYRLDFNLPPQGLVEVSRVPLFVKVFNKTGGKSLRQSTTPLDKPMFCFPGYVSALLGAPQSHFLSRLNEICDKYPAQTLIDPQWQRATFPAELYGELLF